MKKILTFSMGALLLLSTAVAQDRKTWDFTKGWSEETKANLNADANWASNRTDSLGNTTGWKDATKMSGTLMANGVVITELEGLVFGTAGLSTSNNYLLDPASIRMSRAGMVVSIPDLQNGQTVTIRAKSANSTSARGITANTDVLVKEAGPEGDIAPGSDGVQEWVWHVETTSEEAVPVSFKILVGGVDISLIQIDNGDGGDIESDPNIAWVYDSSVAGEYDETTDPLMIYTPVQNYPYVLFDLATYASEEKSMADSLETFDVVVYSTAITAESSFATFLYEEMNRVPVLNFNGDLYAAWGVGSKVLPDPAASAFTIAEAALEDELFADCVVDGGLLTIYNDGDVVTDPKCYGYASAEGGDFEDDEILAYAGGVPAIHVHGSKNTYMLLPISPATLEVEGEPINSDDLYTLVDNAIRVVRQTKGSVSKANKPALSYEYENGLTIATLKSGIPGARIYYTLDGTEPTKASTRYAEPLNITAAGTVINAIVIAPAYTVSDMLSDTVVVKTKLAAPTYSINVADGVANVVLAAAEGDVYYNILGSDDPAKSSLYVDSIGLAITRPTILTVFAYAEDKLPSDKVGFVVDLADQTYYNDTLLHEPFQAAEWTPGTNLAAQANYYSSEVADSTITVNEDGTQDTTYTYVPNNALQEVFVNDLWKTSSYGQRILVQNTGVNNNVGTTYGPATALDAGASGYGFSFLQAGKSGDPATAKLISRVTYKAPFCIGLYFTGQGESGNGKLNGTYREAVEISISTDSTNWTVVDTLATNYMKLMSYQTLEVTGEGDYYIQFASANPAKYSNKQKTMIFDVYIFGPSAERPSTGISEVISGNKSVKAIRMYNLSGQQVTVATPGINVIQTIYSDGTTSTRKVMVK